MQELPPDPIETQQDQDLPFAGLLSELLQQWDSAEETAEETPGPELEVSESETNAEPVSEEPLTDSIGADLLLARFAEAPEEEAAPAAVPDTVPEIGPVDPPEPDAVLPVHSLLCMEEAFADLAAVEPEPEEPSVAIEPEIEPEAETPPPALPGDGNLAILMASLEQELRESDTGAVPAAQSESGPRARYITFTLAGSIYALELKHVIETDRVPPSTNVPGTPAFVRGIINLRGEVLALLELRELLDLGPSDQPGMERMLVVKTSNSDGPCGLIVDRLGGMALMDPSQLQPMPGDGSKVSQVLSGVGEHRGHLVNVLDLEELFAGSDIRELAGICI